MKLRIWKSIITIALCFNLFVSGEEEPTYTVVPDQTLVPILTPSLAERQTLKIRLENGLEAYLISDPEAMHAGAVLTVQAGSWNDPDEYPGLAHFLEHMLFLGTEKYPIESDYDRFIRAHDGKSNAYTSTDYTLYLFSISPSAFEEALDRFSFFFKKPLFHPSGVERELNAINQEFAKNFNQEETREYYVKKALANTQHPFHRFSAGNSQTLGKVTQKTLTEWYQQHYSAHHMRLIVYGPQSIDILRNWTLEDFKDIPSTGQHPVYPHVSALAEEMQGKLVYIEPLRDIHMLRLTWELPSFFANKASCQTANFISFILGYEGKGSLLAKLKAEGFANNTACSSYRMGKEHLLFSLSINLTAEGFNHIPEVIERCFQAIQFLQQQELPLYLFEELKKMETICYQYQSRENTFDFLMHLGGLLTYEDLSSFPETALIPQTFDSNLMREFLSQLAPQRTHFTLLARNPSLQFDQKEPWMGTSYKIVPIEKHWLNSWSTGEFDSDFHFPPPNPFIPQDLRLINSSHSHSIKDSLLPEPRLLIDQEQAKIYFAEDHRFHVPQTLWFFEIKTPAIENGDPTKVALADLYIKSLEEALQPYSYPAELAGLSYGISRTVNGIQISLSGYHDNAQALFEIILSHLKNCKPAQCSFSNFKDALLGQYHDFSYEGPLKKGMEIYQSILFESYSHPQSIIKALEQLSYSSLSAYIDHLFDQTYIEGLLYGNVSEEHALQMWQKLQQSLASLSFPKEERLVERIITLPSHSGPYLIEQTIPSSAHAAILGVENGNFSFKRRAAQQILAQAMNSAFYATLRTKQQTGYLLFSRAEELNRHLFFSFAVQSASHDPRDLIARFELFLEGFLQEMGKSELTQENFEHIRQSLLNTLENSPQNFNETGDLLKALAFKYEGDFDWMTKRIQGLKELKYEEFLEMAKEFLGKENKRRLAILIRGKEGQDFQYHLISSPQNMREMGLYMHE